MLKILKLWLPVLVWAVIIFLFSAKPTGVASEIHWQDFVVKKTAHIIEYAILTLLVYRAMKESGASTGNAALFAIFLAVVYGATDEFHQSFTPGREPKIRDVVFDTIGSVLSVYCIWNLLPKAPKRLKKLAKSLQLL